MAKKVILTDAEGVQILPYTKTELIVDFPSTMTPASHTHGNITNGGKIGSTADQIVVTGTGGALTTANASTARTKLGLGTAATAATTTSIASGGTGLPTAGTVYTALSGKEDTSNKTTAVNADSTDTQYPSAKAVYDAISAGFAANDAMVYKGTVAGTATSPGGFTVAANKGDVYKVSAAGYVNGVKVETGDMLICNTDSTAAATASNYTTIKTKWDYIQTNVDLATTSAAGLMSAADKTKINNLSNVTNNAQVKGLASGTTSGHVVTWGADGYTVADSGYTIGASVPSDAEFTDTKVTSVDNHYTPSADSTAVLGSANQAVNATKPTGNDAPKAITSGNGFKVVTGLERDAAGHVTGLLYTSVYSTDTNTKVTSAANHYVPAADASSVLGSSDKAVNASAPTTVIDITNQANGLEVVTGLQRDAKGHITGLLTTNIKSTDSNSTYTGEKGIDVADGKIGHSNTAVTAVTTNSFKKIAYDAYGHITGSANVAKSDLTGLGVEDASNKVTSWSATTSNTKYPSEKLVKDSLDAKLTANTAITGATKCKITYDANGLVTAGADLAASDIPSLAASKITSGTFADARIASAATWNAKQDALTAQTAYSAKGSATKVPQITTNELGQVTAITEVTITQPTVNNAKFSVKANGTEVSSTTANASSATAVDFVPADNSCVTVTADATNKKVKIGVNVDTALNTTSTNPLTNAAATAKFNTCLYYTEKGTTDDITVA